MNDRLSLCGTSAASRHHDHADEATHTEVELFYDL